MMEQIMDYIKPELLVVSVVLYFAGIGLKKSRVVPDKFIPLILGAAGIVICAVWVIASCPLDTGADIAMGIFTAIVQGVLVAGLSTFASKIVKQICNKNDSKTDKAD